VPYLRLEASFLPRNEVVSKSLLRKGKNWLVDRGIPEVEHEGLLTKAISEVLLLAPAENAVLDTLSTRKGADEAQKATNLALRKEVDMGRRWTFIPAGAAIGAAAWVVGEELYTSIKEVVGEVPFGRGLARAVGLSLPEATVRGAIYGFGRGILRSAHLINPEGSGSWRTTAGVAVGAFLGASIGWHVSGQRVSWPAQNPKK
jgi:hypothetical protein